jgi:hypothetical protein
MAARPVAEALYSRQGHSAMIQEPEHQPTLIERLCATALLSFSLAAAVSALAMFVWWLYEAAVYQKVRGHGGRWVERADTPAMFLFDVGVDCFWASVLSIGIALAAKRLSAKGCWAATVAQIVRSWRQRHEGR